MNRTASIGAIFCASLQLGACRAVDDERSSGVAPGPTTAPAVEPSSRPVQASDAPTVSDSGEVARQPDAPTEPPAEPATFTPATRGTGKCVVTVSALLEAEEFRGPGPLTPALAAKLDADPDFARMYAAESHGDHHIQCVYRVELDHEPGKHYRWKHHFNNVLRDKAPDDCNDLAAEVAEDIVRSTKDCTDHQAGAYWGFVLEPM